MATYTYFINQVKEEQKPKPVLYPLLLSRSPLSSWNQHLRRLELYTQVKQELDFQHFLQHEFWLDDVNDFTILPSRSVLG
jgi:hypothetical protein